MSRESPSPGQIERCPIKKFSIQEENPSRQISSDTGWCRARCQALITSHWTTVLQRTERKPSKPMQTGLGNRDLNLPGLIESPGCRIARQKTSRLDNSLSSNPGERSSISPQSGNYFYSDSHTRLRGAREGAPFMGGSGLTGDETRRVDRKLDLNQLADHITPRTSGDSWLVTAHGTAR